MNIVQQANQQEILTEDTIQDPNKPNELMEDDEEMRFAKATAFETKNNYISISNIMAIGVRIKYISVQKAYDQLDIAD